MADFLVGIAVGPALDCRSGLTEDEQLKKQVNYYLEDYV